MCVAESDRSAPRLYTSIACIQLPRGNVLVVAMELLKPLALIKLTLITFAFRNGGFDIGEPT